MRNIRQEIIPTRIADQNDITSNESGVGQAESGRPSLQVW